MVYISHFTLAMAMVSPIRKIRIRNCEICYAFFLVVTFTFFLLIVFEPVSVPINTERGSETER